MPLKELSITQYVTNMQHQTQTNHSKINHTQVLQRTIHIDIIKMQNIKPEPNKTQV